MLQGRLGLHEEERRLLAVPGPFRVVWTRPAPGSPANSEASGGDLGSGRYVRWTAGNQWVLAVSHQAPLHTMLQLLPGYTVLLQQTATLRGTIINLCRGS